MTRMLARIAPITLALLLSISAFAATKSEKLSLLHDAQLNGTTIPAGDYTVKYEPAGNTTQVKVMKGNKEVATATGQVKELTAKPDHNQVVLSNSSGGAGVPSISEMQFSRSRTGISFGSGVEEAGNK